MWTFRRAAKSPSGPAPDPAQGDPDARLLISAAQRGDAPTIAQFLTDVDHPDDRAFYCDVVAESAGDGAWLDQWIAAEPRSATPLTIKGMHAVKWAWEARGGGRANRVSPGAFRIFFDRLHIAQEFSDRSIDLDHDDPTPWVTQVILGRALDLGVDETTRRFDQVRRRHLWHVNGHDQMLQQLCRKWGGSHDQMHGFAEATLATAPAGSPLGYLVAAAHLERWLDMPAGEDTRYIQSAATGGRLSLAAELSVNHPDYRRRPGWAWAENTFAMAFSLNRNLPAAAARFRTLGDVVTEHPWYWLGGPGAAFAKARAEALR
jgi:hypothetical protein